jgi:integrase
VTSDVLAGYVAERRRSGLSGSTVRRELRCIRRGLVAAQRKGWIIALPDFPDAGRHVPTPRGAGKLHDLATIARWLAAITCDETRDECVVALLTGLRAAEIKRIVPAWVERVPEGSAVPALLRVPAESAKARRTRVVGLPAAVVKIIERRATAHDVPVFSSSDHKKERLSACRRIGYPRSITLRDLRHAHATLAAVATGDAAAVQAAMGHTDLATTQLYLSTTLQRTFAVSASVALKIEQVGTGSPAQAADETVMIDEKLT